MLSLIHSSSIVQIHSSSIVHSYGCVVVALIIVKLTGFTKDARGLFLTINIHHLRSYLKRIALFLFMKKMYKFWLPKCIMSAITFQDKDKTLSVFPAFSKSSISRNRKSFLFRVKSLGYTPKYLRKYRRSIKRRLFKKGKKETRGLALENLQEELCKCRF